MPRSGLSRTEISLSHTEACETTAGHKMKGRRNQWLQRFFTLNLEIQTGSGSVALQKMI